MTIAIIQWLLALIGIAVELWFIYILLEATGLGFQSQIRRRQQDKNDAMAEILYQTELKSIEDSFYTHNEGSRKGANLDAKLFKNIFQYVHKAHQIISKTRSSIDKTGDPMIGLNGTNFMTSLRKRFFERETTLEQILIDPPALWMITVAGLVKEEW